MNIDSEGAWIETARYVEVDQEVVQQVGQSVGNIMQWGCARGRAGEFKQTDWRQTDTRLTPD